MPGAAPRGLAPIPSLGLALPLRSMPSQRFMRYLLLLLAFLSWSTAYGFDTSTQGVVISGYVTSQVTTAPFDKKVIVEARDDAAAFVASKGQIRGVRLEAALAALRHSTPGMNANDLELAQAILVQ